MSTPGIARPTPFTVYHRALGAKLVEFAGFELPLRYTGDLREHLCVRNAVGVFDITHMGEYHVSGPAAGEFIHRMVTNDVLGMQVGQAIYTAMCRPDGGIVDDLLVYRLPDRWMMVVNGATNAKDWAWLKDQVPAGVEFRDISEETALLAVQGPKAEQVLRGHVPDAALELGFYRLMEGAAFGAPAVISRTGYTGEDGFELVVPAADGPRLWRRLLERGVQPCGLGARDTLRLEAALPLYGNDIDESTNPFEAGLGWTVTFDDGADFVGREALLRLHEAGVSRQLACLKAMERGVMRAGCPLLHDGRPVGRLTSGGFSPTLGASIGLGYLPPELAAAGTQLEVDVRGKPLRAQVVPRPFYRRPKAE